MVFIRLGVKRPQVQVLSLGPEKGSKSQDLGSFSYFSEKFTCPIYGCLLFCLQCSAKTNACIQSLFHFHRKLILDSSRKSVNVLNTAYIDVTNTKRSLTSLSRWISTAICRRRIADTSRCRETSKLVIKDALGITYNKPLQRRVFILFVFQKDRRTSWHRNWAYVRPGAGPGANRDRLRPGHPDSR